MAYQDYVRRTILDPLGMAATTYDVARVPPAVRAQGYRWEGGRWTPEPILADGEYGAMGGMWTTARDYARYVGFLLSAWPARDGPDDGPIRRATVRELGQAQGFPKTAEMQDAAGRRCTTASAYSYGMLVGSGCGVGRFVQHSGGLPGYGSNVLLLPDAGVGLFVFANRTYAPTFRANLAAATALVPAGLAASPPVPVTPGLRVAIDGALRAYQAGRIEAMSGLLATNVLLDRSAAQRDGELAALRRRYGACRAGTVTASSGTEARFGWACERGRLDGAVLLAPEARPTVQTIEFGSP